MTFHETSSPRVEKRGQYLVKIKVRVTHLARCPLLVYGLMQHTVSLILLAKKTTTHFLKKISKVWTLDNICSGNAFSSCLESVGLQSNLYLVPAQT